jgi:hypothetical protein
MPQGHPLSRLKVVQVHDLAGLEFISLGPGDPMRLQLDALCEQNDVTRTLKTKVALSHSCIVL